MWKMILTLLCIMSRNMYLQQYIERNKEIISSSLIIYKEFGLPYSFIRTPQGILFNKHISDKFSKAEKSFENLEIRFCTVAMIKIL